MRRGREVPWDKHARFGQHAVSDCPVKVFLGHQVDAPVEQRLEFLPKSEEREATWGVGSPDVEQVDVARFVVVAASGGAEHQQLDHAVLRAQFGDRRACGVEFDHGHHITLPPIGH